MVVDTPTLLAATWIALQNIEEDSGELAYYGRSHRPRHYIFQTAASIPAATRQTIRATSKPHAKCASSPTAGCSPKRSNVFFGESGAPQQSARPAARLSCVTHNCPATSMPHWFVEPEKLGTEPFWDAGGFASSFYALPNRSQMMRPAPRWEFYNRRRADRLRNPAQSHITTLTLLGVSFPPKVRALGPLSRGTAPGCPLLRA